MGRRRRKNPTSARSQRRLPTIFKCPNCGKDAIRIQYAKERSEALVRCGACRIFANIKVNSLMESVDVYGDFVDTYEFPEVTETVEAEVKEELTPEEIQAKSDSPFSLKSP